MAGNLDDVPGLGPAKREALLRRFGTVRAVFAASEGELLQVDGIGPRLATAISAAGRVSRPGGGRPLEPLYVRDRVIDFRRAIQLTSPVAAYLDPGGPPRAEDVASLAREVGTAVVEWLRRNGPRAMLFGAVGFVVGWIINTYVMARTYDGFNVPSGGAATGRGNFFWGTAIYLVGSVIVTTVISYRLNVGGERFWADVRGFPATMGDMVRRDGDRALTHLLWGFAGSMIVVLVLAPSFSGLLAVGVLVALGSTLRPLVTGTVLTVWRTVSNRFFPDRPPREQVHSLTVASLGTAAAFAVGFLVAGTIPRLVLGALAAGVAWWLAQQRQGKSPTGGQAAALVVLAGLGLALAASGTALADDGGWAECGSSLAQWVRCGGSAEVWLLATLGGTATGAGAAIGAGLGEDGLGAGGGDSDDDRPWDELTDHEKRKRLTRHFHEKHPDATAEEIAEMVDGYLAASAAGPPEEDTWEKLARLWEQAKREGQMLTTGDFWKAFGDELWSDASSGAMRDRIFATLEAMDAAPGQILSEMWEAGGALWENREELLQAGMDWLVNTPPDQILEQIAGLPGDISSAVIDQYQQQLTELAEASLAGDDQKVADILGRLAGEAQFGVLLGAGMGKAMEGGADYLNGVRRRSDGPDGPDGPDRRLTDEEREWVKEDPYARPPMTVSEIEAKLRDLGPGERIKLTPEEAAAWGGYEKQMLVTARENSLLYGKGPGADDKPWVELKRGNNDALERRQEGYVDADGNHREYNPKPNHIKDKSLEANEMFFVPDAYRDGMKPGEVVSFKPTRIPEVGETLPNGQVVDQDLVDRLDRRLEQADEQIGGKTSKSGPTIDRYGKQVMGESRLMDDGHWQTRQQVHDSSGRHPSDPGYQPTWSSWDNVAGDSDTFAIGGGAELTPRHAGDLGVRTVIGHGPDGKPIYGYEMTEAERLAYAASDGTVPGEGNTPFRYTAEKAGKDFDQGKYDDTMRNTSQEGVLLIDADGYFLTTPGTHY